MELYRPRRTCVLLNAMRFKVISNAPSVRAEGMEDVGILYPHPLIHSSPFVLTARKDVLGPISVGRRCSLCIGLGSLICISDQQMNVVWCLRTERGGDVPFAVHTNIEA